MSSNNSTSPPTQDNRNSGIGAATYYGAVAVVVFVLVALTLLSRCLYTRKARRMSNQRSVDETSRDTEERVAMERRGEAVGLPTYRESVLPTSRNPILESTPIAGSRPSGRSASIDTLANPPAVNLTVFQLSASEPSLSPPKYEDATDDADHPPRIDIQAINPEDRQLSDEMRERNGSVVTLVVPSISVVDVDQPVPPSGQLPTNNHSSCTED